MESKILSGFFWNDKKIYFTKEFHNFTIKCYWISGNKILFKIKNTQNACKAVQNNPFKTNRMLSPWNFAGSTVKTWNRKLEKGC